MVLEVAEDLVTPGEDFGGGGGLIELLVVGRLMVGGIEEAVEKAKKVQ